MTELKPCPRPGCESNRISICGDYLRGIQVGCMDCHFVTLKHNSRTKAIKAWNSRSGYGTIEMSKDRELLIYLLNNPIGYSEQIYIGDGEWVSSEYYHIEELRYRIRKHLEENP